MNFLGAPANHDEVLDHYVNKQLTTELGDKLRPLAYMDLVRPKSCESMGPGDVSMGPSGRWSHHMRRTCGSIFVEEVVISRVQSRPLLSLFKCCICLCRVSLTTCVIKSILNSAPG